MNVNNVAYAVLVEEANISKFEFNALTEEFKENTLQEFTSNILSNLKNKLNSPEMLKDLTLINKSRGEIKNFQFLEIIQTSINKLNNLIQNSDEHNPELKKYLNQIIQSLFNLNKYSNVFKDAYRSKKTILILKYQAIILAIISSLSYLVSVSIDFKDQYNLKLKNKINIEEISPLKSILKYNESIENGMFINESSDISEMKKYFNEVQSEISGIVYEAADISSVILNGINAFNNLFNNPQRNRLLLKVSGIVLTLLSLRDIFYSFFNTKNKLTDLLNNLNIFNNVSKIPSVSSLSRFITFNNKNVADMENASNLTTSEISHENKKIIDDVKNKPSEFDQTAQTFIPEKTDDATSMDNIDDIFASFNF